MTSLRRRVLAVAPLALIAYVPLLLTARGKVAADTKTYLYLDPARLLSRAWSMWDPNIGLGTVTHQTIGYLWPMGPWFWAFDELGAPDWVAQRLWVATVMVAAGVGVLYLLRTLGLRHVPSIVAAAMVYELSPYVLHYAARISVILLPWAALPWLVALVQRTLQTRSWRHPAAFALVVATAGGVNATALVLAGLGPALWIPFAVLVHRDATWRDAGRAVTRIGILTTLTSLWWIAGLWVQGGWGIDILRYTETVETVARTSLASEVLRGLGYWFFYGGDKLGSWIEPGRSYTQNLPLIAAGFAMPLLAFGAVAVSRWRYRAAAVAMIALGTAIAVGAYPYSSPSPAGAAFKKLATTSTVGMALRSTPRVIPLVVLGIALLIGSALASRRLTAAAVAVGLLAVLGIPPLWTGELIGENLQRPEEIPSYWKDAAGYLDAQPHATRVLEVPGTDFASYRWGNTVDPITPGLIDRPYVARELIPYGTPPAADLLIALDRRIQEMVDDPDAIAPVASLLGAGDVVLRSDLQYERYRTPRPRTLWAELNPAPKGLGAPKAFGPPAPNDAIASLPLHDEVYLATPATAPDPPPVAAFGVAGGMPVVRARAARAPIVIAGDGEGIVEAAAAGLLGGHSVILTSAAIDKAVREQAMGDGAALVLTDTNRVRGRRWSTMRDNAGYTESPGETPLRDDPSDNRLPLYPDAPKDAYTTIEQRGVKAVRATAYGNPVSFTPEDRAALAIDGDVGTAWQVGALAGVGGERWRLETARPVTSSTINVVQRLSPLANRWITELEVRVDGRKVTTVHLDDRSQTPDGQPIDLGGTRTFSSVELVVRGDNVGKLAKYDGLSGVGFAEVRVGGVKVDEVVHLPSDLLRGGSSGHALSIVLARLRSNPIEPTAGDEELAITRAFSLPEPRSFALSGEARISASLADDGVDRMLGAAAVQTSSRLTGDLTSRGASAVDGDPATAWTTAFGEQRGQWITAASGVPFRLDELDLQVLADGDHSVPTKLHLTTDGDDSVDVDVPALPDRPRGHVASVRVPIGEVISGTRLHVEVTDVREVRTIDWYSKAPITMPLGIAELGVLAPKRAAGSMSSACRRDLLTIDGDPVGVRVTGSVADAERRKPLDLALCGSGLRLAAGAHELRAARGATSGFDLDRLVLTSDEDGRAATPPAAGALPRAADDVSLTVVHQHRDAVTVDVTASTPFWLVLGQSNSSGWTASGLGAPTLVDGYANGWYVQPKGTGPMRITMRFTPQRVVDATLLLSLLGAVLCVLIIAASWRGAAPRPVARAGDPVWVSPWGEVGARPRALVIGGIALAGGVVAGLADRPVLGIAVAAALVLGLVLRRGPGLLATIAIAALGLAAAFTIAKQWRNHYPADFGWPGFFAPAHHLAWVALLLMVAAVAAGAARRRARPPDRPRRP